ncbi:MAG TPA: flagellar hook-length control protein FliK [Bacteroidetes bacterium]|nr:flagellar hook-length control protein FliK [Bacteroidota bacterium]
MDVARSVSTSVKRNGGIPHSGTIVQPGTTVDHGKLVSNIRMTLSSGRNELVLQLKPEVLGRALISLRQGEKGVELKFEVEHPDARRIFEAEATHLKEALNAAGIHTVSIEVRTSDSQPDRFAQTDEGSTRNRQQQDRGDGDPGDRRRKERFSRPRFFGYNSFDIAA